MKTAGLLLVLMISMSDIFMVNARIEEYLTNKQESQQMMLQQTLPQDLISNTKNAIDGFTAITQATSSLSTVVGGLTKLSSSLGMAGALVGLVFSFIGVQNPDVAMLQNMITDTQNKIAVGNQDILNAIRKLNSQEAQRSAQDSISILESLVTKHMITKVEYQYGSYQVLPCGPQMTLCNNAFIDLSKRLEDILSSSFEESPRGDKTRVGQVGDNLIKLLVNSYYSVTWLNAKFANETNPNSIDINNNQTVAAVSQASTLKIYLDKAIKSFQTWVIDKKFQTCRLCDSCGGDYPNYGGEGYTTPEVGWWLRFSDKCTGSLYEKNNIPQICCSADKPPCQWCLSCGGDYPDHISQKLNIDHWSSFNVKGNMCSGSFQKLDNEAFLCCRNQRQCKWCDGECGGQYTKLGYIVDRNDRGQWDAYSPSKCNENYQGGPDNGEATSAISLCCLDFTE